MSKTSKIAEAYDLAEPFYRLFWGLGASHSMNYGYWKPETKTLKQALRNQKELIVRLAKLQPNQTVLDAGCGYGGMAVYLAKEHAAKVEGITLSQRQRASAERRAAKLGLSHLCRFSEQDYHSTSFQPALFDLSLMQESFFHSFNHVALLREMARLLKRGGRLIIADYFLADDLSGLPKEIQEWKRGYQAHGLTKATDLIELAEKEGLALEVQEHCSTQVMRSSKRLNRLGKMAWLLARLFGWLPLARKWLDKEKALALMAQYTSLKAGYWNYQILSFNKS